MSLLLKGTMAAGLIAGISGAFHGLDLDDRLGYHYQAWSTPEHIQQNSVWLPDYQVDREAVPLEGVKDNLSGITYNPDTNSLWVVINQPQQLIELDQQLQPKRTITLENFVDTEAIAYAGNNRLVIADEREQSVVIATIDDNTESLDKLQLQRLTLNTGGENNKGLEGLAINPTDQTIFAARERDPMELISIQGMLSSSNNIRIDNPLTKSLSRIYWDDLSGLHFDPTTKNLLVLSHEAELLSSLSLDGIRISHMDLEAGFSGLQADIPQAEGVTLDDKGDLYIVSEPNLIYRFKKQ